MTIQEAIKTASEKRVYFSRPCYLKMGVAFSCYCSGGDRTMMLMCSIHMPPGEWAANINDILADDWIWCDLKKSEPRIQS